MMLIRYPHPRSYDPIHSCLYKMMRRSGHKFSFGRFSLGRKSFGFLNLGEKITRRRRRVQRMLMTCSTKFCDKGQLRRLYAECKHSKSGAATQIKRVPRGKNYAISQWKTI